MSEQATWWPDLQARIDVIESSAAVNPRTHDSRLALLTDRLDGMTVFTLTRPEQLLLWSARRWRHGRFRWDQVEAEFKRVLPGGWADTLLGWEQVMELMHLYPAQQPQIGNGCATALSGDERGLLTLLAILQRPRQVRPHLLLQRLAAPALQQELRALLVTVATSLSMAGEMLPLRGPTPIPSARPAGLRGLVGGRH